MMAVLVVVVVVMMGIVIDYGGVSVGGGDDGHCD